MKHLILSLALVLMMTGVALAQNFTQKDITIVRADGTEAVFHVEVAIDAYQHEVGLMRRTELANDAGMIFLYEYPALRSFWMKGTLIPLDMLFFTEAGQLVDIRHNAQPKDLSPYAPDRADICAVLEIAGGQAEAQNIKIGDRLMLDTPTACLPEGAGSRRLPTKRPQLGGGV